MNAAVKMAVRLLFGERFGSAGPGTRSMRPSGASRATAVPAVRSQLARRKARRNDGGARITNGGPANLDQKSVEIF